jgi:hypothetical protein
MGKKGSTHGIKGVMEVKELIQAQRNHLLMQKLVFFYYCIFSHLEFAIQTNASGYQILPNLALCPSFHTLSSCKL